MTNVIVLQEHTPGTPLYTPSRCYTPGKFWYTLGCTIHPVDKHCTTVHGPTALTEQFSNTSLSDDIYSI